MFNTCPGCGEYDDERQVLGSPDRTVCRVCKYEHEFLRLPLFVVTGASGSGKTTAALELMKATESHVILDQDILWSDAFNVPEDNYKMFRNTWLRMIKNIHQAGRPVVLFGSAVPEQFESCPERRYLKTIRYMTLVCEPEELERRLTARPRWRNSASPETLKSMLEFNAWLKDNAATTRPPMVLCDTTGITVQETVESIRRWFERD